MRRLSILLFFLTTATYAQDYSFVYEDDLIWQKVFETDLDSTSVADYFSKKFKLTNSDGSLIGPIFEMEMDYKGAGKNEMTTAMYISRSHLKGDLEIQQKNNRYRVTLRSIKMVQYYNVGNYGDILSSSKDETNGLEKFAIKKGDFRKGFLKRDAAIFEHTFNKEFRASKPKTSNDDW